MNAPQQQRSPQIDFVTDVGRLVSGDVHTASAKGYRGAVRKTPRYWFAVAIPKNAPRINELLGRFYNHAMMSYSRAPAVQQAIQSYPIGSMPPPGYEKGPFAWKIEDGDHPDNVTKEGRAGCWIIAFSTPLTFDVLGPQKQQIDPKSVKLGCYVQMSGRMSINDNYDGTAGIYINPTYVWVVGDGPVIRNQPSPDEVFGREQPQLPPGVQPWTGTPAPVAHQGTYAPPAGYLAGNPTSPTYSPATGYGPAPSAYAPHAAPNSAPAPQPHSGYQPAPPYAPPASPAPYQPSPAPPPPQGAPAPAYAPPAGYPPQYQPQPAPYAPAPASSPPAYAPPAVGQGVPAGAIGALAPGYGQQPSPATAYPSSGYAPAPAPAGVPAGVQPHTAFVQGPPR